MPQMYPVVGSERILAYGYEQGLGGAGALYLEFVGGARWRYDGVTPAVLEGFLLADSKGSYFARSIKGQFAEVQLDQSSA